MGPLLLLGPEARGSHPYQVPRIGQDGVGQHISESRGCSTNNPYRKYEPPPPRHALLYHH